MSVTGYGAEFEAILASVRQPARLIGEEAGAGPGFSGAPDELRVVLGFPDTYEIVISNQALQILYHLARSTDGVAVERAYLPWVDAIDEMRRRQVPLLTLESWTPVSGCELLGVTLQHEFHYTNLLEMLDLAGLPVHAEDRDEDHPLVLVGGPACANSAPIRRFVDAIAVGDGEELFTDILEVMKAAVRGGASRAEKKRMLADVPGVFVPGSSTRVRRRTIARLEGAPYPAGCLVPLVAGVHDRAWVEVMRGCTRGCRFCQAGMWYRPVRERPAREVLRLAGDELAQTGHQELAFASLSTTDYSPLEAVLSEMAAAHPDVTLSLPSLRVDSASVHLARMASPTGASITLAPEAGSQRMRDIINKNITEDDVLSATQEALRTGRTTLKLYFMIGLPWETDEDVVAIADLCLKVRQTGRQTLAERASRLQLNVSVNTFIPKPFTPFQWAPVADRDTVRRRQALLRERLRKPGIRLAMPDPGKSYLETALARGDESMAAVVETAWRKGARFDAWTEQFRAGAWAEAFEEKLRTSAETLATAQLLKDQSLPWDFVEGVPDHDFLWGEWEKASRGELTGDCRWDGCEYCGACDEPPGNVLTPDFEMPLGPRPTDRAPQPGTAPPVSTRYVACFSVRGRGRFLGHLDRQEAFRRAVRRAGGRLALSAGMRPKPLLSLALPLGVGVEGEQELCEFELAEEAPADFAERLDTALPKHMRLLSLRVSGGGRRLGARVTGASYEIVFEVAGTAAGEPGVGRTQTPTAAGDAGGQAAVESRLAAGERRFAEAAEWTVEESREGRVRNVDVKLYVDQVVVRRDRKGWVLAFSASVTPTGTARPELVLKALSQAAGLRLQILSVCRLAIQVD